MALEHFVFSVIPSLDHIFDNYQPDLAFSTIKSVQSGWMGGMINAEINIYEYIVFLLITIPYASSFYRDSRAGILKNIAVRGEKKYYFAAKSTAVFLSSGTVAVFPLLLNLMLTTTVLPIINYCWSQMPFPTAFFINIAVKDTVLYALVYMVLIFIFAGLIGGLALSISLYANNLFVVLTLPFFIFIVSGRLFAYSDNLIIKGLSMLKVFYLPQSSPTTIISIIVLFIVLSICGYTNFIINGAKRDVL